MKDQSTFNHANETVTNGEPPVVNSAKTFAQIKESMYHALETYSNVHRGSGHFSMLTTKLYEDSRRIVLDYLDLSPSKYTVVFGGLLSEHYLAPALEKHIVKRLDSSDFELNLGVIALVIKKKSLPKTPTMGGGGTTKMIATSWVIWADSPERFEPGTPAIINVIGFARALQLAKMHGERIFSFSTQTASNNLSEETNGLRGKELLRRLNQAIIGKDMKVPTSKGDETYIHLDNSASTPALKPVWDTFAEALTLPAPELKSLVDRAKEICLNFVEAPPDKYDVLFTRNTTEAIHVASTCMSEPTNDEPRLILSSLLEHSSNDIPWRMLPNTKLLRLECDQFGFFDMKQLEEMLKEKQLGDSPNPIQLVALNGASNVLGSCNSIHEMGTIVKKHNTRLLVDAAQLIAHKKVVIKNSGVDFLAFSAHKIYAPFGCGVLIFKKDHFQPDESQKELIDSFALENAAGIAALAKSLQLIQKVGFEHLADEEQGFVKKTVPRLQKIRDLNLYGISGLPSERKTDRLGILVFEIKNRMPAKLAKALAYQGGLGVRYGCHCAHIIIKHILNVGPGLERFQKFIQILFPAIRFQGLVRISFGIGNQESDIDKFLTTMESIGNKEKDTEPYTASQTKSRINHWIKERIRMVFPA